MSREPHPLAHPAHSGWVPPLPHCRRGSSPPFPTFVFPHRCGTKSAEAGSFPRFGDMARIETWMADPPATPAPQTQAVEIEIDHRGGIKCQQLADHQPADDRNAERA